jgi:uncharacterized protein YqeY
MTLQEQLQADLKTAIANKDNETKEILKVVVSELTRGLSKEATDEKALSVIRGLKESAILCGKTDEIAVYDRYLPQMLSEEKVVAIVSDIIIELSVTTKKDIGKIMGQLSKHPQATQIDKKFASTVINKLLV